LTQTPDTPAFDVVSVKPNVSGDENSSSCVQPGGRYTAANMTVRMLIRTAYGVHGDQIAGGPGWIDTERFDIVAKAEGYASGAAFRDQARVMLRKALADRFRLTLVPELVRSDMERCQGPVTSLPAAQGAAEPSPAMPCDSSFFRAGHIGARAVEFPTLVTRLGRHARHRAAGTIGVEAGVTADHR
jgi:hypothetical protein